MDFNLLKSSFPLMLQSFFQFEVNEKDIIALPTKEDTSSYLFILFASQR